MRRVGRVRIVSLVPHATELLFALGAALFVANAFALYRRRADAETTARKTVARSRPGSPVRGNRRSDERDVDLAAP